MSKLWLWLSFAAFLTAWLASVIGLAEIGERLHYTGLSMLVFHMINRE